MTLADLAHVADLLLVPLYLLAFLVPGVWFLLWRAGRGKPRINALSWTTRFVGVVSFVIVIYVLAVGNAGAGYPVAREWAQIALRGVVLALGFLAVWFAWLYRTGRFNDGPEPLAEFSAWLQAHRRTVTLREIEHELDRRLGRDVGT